ncbi:hypothetical protein D3C74_326560 [compost metagenome]
MGRNAQDGDFHPLRGCLYNIRLAKRRLSLISRIHNPRRQPRKPRIFHDLVQQLLPVIKFVIARHRCIVIQKIHGRDRRMNAIRIVFDV